jgi:hypothetical protein
MTIDSYPQEDYDLLATLWFEDGGIGGGQPVANVITVDGQSASVCNIGLARVHLRFKPLEEALCIRGNSNGDSRVSISDAIWILNELFFSGPPSPCQEAADTNDDGAVDASDAVLIVRHQFLGGAAPAPPFPLCGSVPEEDLLGCPEAQAACY